MFSPTERKMYYTLNYHAAKVRAEMIVLAVAASEAAFADVVDEYINQEGVEEAEKNDMIWFGNKMIEDQRETVLDRLMTTSPKKISEIYSILVDAAGLIDEEDEEKVNHEDLLREFAEEAEK
ncbi:MAG: hypothetical protein PHW63_07740 [Alphaproteobacteria bacterium]|nr:hypothetical protein [Alphaproteobacteria bacterium]